MKKGISRIKCILHSTSLTCLIFIHDTYKLQHLDTYLLSAFPSKMQFFTKKHVPYLYHLLNT